MSKLEIERRFLFDNCNIFEILEKNGINYTISRLEQFYLKATKEETLRYRKENKLYIKNIKRGFGLVREELEKNISKDEYIDAKLINSGGVIKKLRLTFMIDANRYELDIFKGKLKGLSILEIEFSNLKEAQKFKMPEILNPFIIKEITKEPIYTNGALSKSMQIPLREDSFISLNLIKDSNKILKPKYDLYISSYENSTSALKSYLNRFYLSFKENLNIFKQDKNLENLILAIKAAKKIRYTLWGFKKYIKQEDFIKILFNINNFLAQHEKLLSQNRAFKNLLKLKQNFQKCEQVDILKDLINLARQINYTKESLAKSVDYDYYLAALSKSIENIKIKKSFNKPYIYSKKAVLKRNIKKLAKTLKEGNKKEILNRYKILKNLTKFYSVNLDLNEFKYLKKYFTYKSSLEVIKNIDNLLLKSTLNSLFKKKSKEELRKFKKESIDLKKLKRQICNGNRV